MAKKPKKLKAYRLRGETIFAIETLAERWECSRAEVIERVVAGVPIPNRPGTISMPPMANGQTHWQIEGIGKAVPTGDPGEFKIEYDE